MWHVWEMRGALQGFGEGNLGKKRNSLEDLNVYIRIILKWILKKEDGVVRNRLI
jgi:hypothetical protein